MSCRITFNYNERSGFWEHYDSDDKVAEICNSGLMKYVKIPDGVTTLDLIFHVDKPVDIDWFELYQAYVQSSSPTSRNAQDLIRIRTNHGVTWLKNARYFMSKMWNEGFRYVTVEYTA